MAIEMNRKQELKENAGNVLLVEDRYYKTAIAINAFQLFINGLLMFFYSRIYVNTEKEQLAKDTVQKFATDIADTTDQLIKENISNQYIRYMNALSFQLGETDDNKTIRINAKTDKRIGFIPSNDTNDLENRKTKIVSDIKNPTIPNDTNPQNRICKHCNNSFIYKHHKQIYCTDKCRMAHWEVNNNKKLRWNK